MISPGSFCHHTHFMCHLGWNTGLHPRLASALPARLPAQFSEFCVYFLETGALRLPGIHSPPLLSLPSAGIKGVYHHTQRTFFLRRELGHIISQKRTWSYYFAQRNFGVYDSPVFLWWKKIMFIWDTERDSGLGSDKSSTSHYVGSVNAYM